MIQEDALCQGVATARTLGVLTRAARRMAERRGSSGELGGGPASAPSSGIAGSYLDGGVSKAPAFAT